MCHISCIHREVGCTVTNRDGPVLVQIGPDNLRSQARRIIRASITTGETQAGEIYPISYFASQLGVSATPVREALFDLAHEGLVEVVRNRGFRVVVVTDHDLDEIFDLRLMLEVPSAGRIAGKLDREQIRQCREYARQIEDCARQGDLAGFLDADLLFHSGLLQALENRRLAAVVESLRPQARLYGLPQLAQSGRLMDSAREHSTILDAIEEGDAARAETLMRSHIVHSRGIWAGRTERHAASQGGMAKLSKRA
jgi:DNA-binding GntR family transcriptional regulator